MDLEISEGDLKVERSPVRSLLYYRYLNPIGLFLGVRKDKFRNASNLKLELATEMSDVINYLTVKEKQILTIKLGESTLTPQQTFIHFFNRLDLSYVNPVRFRSKFIDMYSRNGKEGLNEFKVSKDKGEAEIIKFWANFAPLIDKREYQPNSYYYKTCGEKMQVHVASLFQTLRRFRRTIFSGQGMH